MSATAALAQVWMNGVIDRAWRAADYDTERFKVELESRLYEAGYLIEVGDVNVIDGQPVIDWPYLYIGKPKCTQCGRKLDL